MPLADGLDFKVEELSAQLNLNFIQGSLFFHLTKHIKTIKNFIVCMAHLEEAIRLADFGRELKPNNFCTRNNEQANFFLQVNGVDESYVEMYKLILRQDYEKLHKVLTLLYDELNRTRKEEAYA